MNILVTGAKGFVGGHLMPALETDHEVFGSDILDGLGADLREPESIERLIRRSHAEVVVHLAHQWPVAEDEVPSAMANIEMATMVARGCGLAGVRLVLGSSSAVYGDGLAACREIEGPFSSPTTISGLAALWGEQAGQALAPDHFTSVRIASVYGPRAPGGPYASSVSEALWRAHHRMPIPVLAGPDRGYCWIGDVVRGIRVAIEKGDGPINIGRDDEIVTPMRIAELACIITGAPTELIEKSSANYMVGGERRVSSSRLQRIGWRPGMALYDGMVALYEGWVKSLDTEGRLTDEVLA